MSEDNFRKQLEEIKNQIAQLRRDTLETRIEIMKEWNVDLAHRTFERYYSYLTHTRSDFGLYFSVFLSAVIGVLGNWYVNLLFQPPSPDVTFGFGLASIILVGAFVFLGIRMFSTDREFKKWSKKVTEAINQFSESINERQKE